MFTKSVERRQRQRQATRKKILGAARELFAREGYDSVTVRAIADRIAYTPPAIYKHFADKDALIRELAADDFRGLSQKLERFARTADPIERLRRIAACYLEFALRHPNHYRLMFMTPRPAGARPGPDDATPAHDAYAFLEMTVEEARARGLLRRGLDDVDEIAQALWAAVHGVAALHIVMRDHRLAWRPARATARRLVDLVLRGLTL
jgi:AcrR family transcriptional regulator